MNLAGRDVLPGPALGDVPRDGLSVALEVWYRGQWVTMHAPRTRSDGRFTLRYQFQDAIGKFPFRVKALAGQLWFPYRAGYSPIIDVSTR
jgi:hypothetical protein